MIIQFYYLYHVTTFMYPRHVSKHPIDQSHPKTPHLPRLPHPSHATFPTQSQSQSHLQRGACNFQDHLSRLRDGRVVSNGGAEDRTHDPHRGHRFAVRYAHPLLHPLHQLTVIPGLRDLGNAGKSGTDYQARRDKRQQQ